MNITDFIYFYIISFNERHNFKLISFNEAQLTLTTFKLIIYLPVCGLQEGVSAFRSYPAGLRDVINYTKHRYNNPPIYITETGTRQCFNPGLSIISSLKKHGSDHYAQQHEFWIGYADFDNGTTPLEEALHDSRRVEYHSQHLSYLIEAIRCVQHIHVFVVIWVCHVECELLTRAF